MPRREPSGSTARASTRGKVVLKAWHVAKDSGKAVTRVKLVNHLIDGKRTSRFGWMTVPLPGELYTGLRYLTLVALAGLIWLIARTVWRSWKRKRWPPWMRPATIPG